MAPNRNFRSRICFRTCAHRAHENCYKGAQGISCGALQPTSSLRGGPLFRTAEESLCGLRCGAEDREIPRSARNDTSGRTPREKYLWVGPSGPTISVRGKGLLSPEASEAKAQMCD